MDEDALLEMALLTEGSYGATVTAVSATTLTFSFPALPAGSYNLIVNRCVACKLIVEMTLILSLIL